jgi:Ca2+-binding EF-hand superfamily protein
MILKREKQAEQEDTLSDAFKLFDRDNNGLITPEELFHVLKNLGENITKEDIEDMIRMIDADGDMAINYDEFIKLMMRPPTNGKK